MVDLGRKGCGVRPCRDVAEGEPVCDYVGEVLSTVDATARQARYDAAGGMNYVLTLLEHTASRVVRTSIDPTVIGGVASSRRLRPACPTCVPHMRTPHVCAPHACRWLR